MTRDLLPTTQAARIHTALRDYLTTTFALADSDARSALDDFLSDAKDGLFKGPFIRTRLPFAPATGWEGALDVVPAGFVPFAHQAAAWKRLSSREQRPQPTLVTTGTGSGKTEAFLMPILDHVLRAKREGQTGLKALLLYPMNALANDQAGRLAKMISAQPEPGSVNPYSGVRAAIYTGDQGGSKRGTVSADGLINDRHVIRQNPPDILLTNYKMLDHLLLRGNDRNLWEQSAESLQFVVLDEFHTYDGAQGTDVAMLLRRLGLTLKAHWPQRGSSGDTHTSEEWERPLGRITPVGTSATLGDGADSSVMTDFASDVFGEDFQDSCVVTESRLSLAEWADHAEPPRGAAPQPITQALINEVNAVIGDSLDGTFITGVLLRDLFTAPPADDADDDTRMRHLQSLPIFKELIELTAHATHIDRIVEQLLPPDIELASGAQFVSHLIAATSHLRAELGRRAANVEVHMWVRELSRIDRAASSATEYLWSDDGELESGEDSYPAIFCRHCGRSGWGVELSPTGTHIVGSSASTRRNHASRQGHFRALIHAPAEGSQHDAEPVEGLLWFDSAQRLLTANAPDPDSPEYRDGLVLPVLAHTGRDAEDDSLRDVCPACQESDGIRFLGSAIATLLSVSLSSMFGTPNLDEREKKALVFTDSVQDAAHRAGFIASRSQVLTMRAVIRDAFDQRTELDLEQLTDEILQRTGDDAFRRHRILPPEFANDAEFKAFWAEARPPRKTWNYVRRRLLFDLTLEFGLASRFGRTLERTGTLSAHVDVGSPEQMASIAREVLEKSAEQTLEDVAPSDELLTQWVRGVAERLRTRGAIMHEWLRSYLDRDGHRWAIWGGRPRNQGMPAFPTGRSAPAFPRHGAKNPNKEQLLDSIHEPTGWYAKWTAQLLGVTPNHGGALVRMLLETLAKEGILESRNTKSNATVYAIPTSQLLVRRISDDDLEDQHLLVCNTCATQWPGAKETVDQLVDAPCLNTRCHGTLARGGLTSSGFYRRLYADGEMRRIVAREHTSLLPPDERLAYEKGFKEGGDDPQQPNALVATPTLEMGIDIGDLSAVFLASLPRTVASYLQRIGRAGRATGNAIVLAYVRGRGEALPRLGDPLSMINGAVRPPAIYLSAVEILQRQYLAHLVDRQAILDRTPDTASGAMQSAEPKTFLGDVMQDAEDHHDEHLQRFLTSFGTKLRDESVQHMQHWVKPTGGPNSSPLAKHIIDASLAWRHRRDELNYRVKEIQTTLPALEQAASLAAATEDAKRAHRMALSAIVLTKAQIGKLIGEYWIAVMEEFGLLPNYTLLGDSTTLDVSISWLNPDTREYEHEEADFQRPTARALTEFVPGATFYSRGWEIKIDAIDLGTNGEAIRPWACCAVCGFVQDLAESGKEVVPKACPRCSSNAIADVGQRLDTVELTRSSADIRRDEARIDDAHDDRDRKRFLVLPTADIDPDHVHSAWYVKGYDFGAKYLTRLTLRWLNLGIATAQASPRTISGEDVPATLFRVCAGCGHIDSAASENHPNEHRPWCQHRNSSEEHTRSVALTRTLTTQGVVIPLPYAVTTGDSLAQPSLEAALLMGIRDEFGGSPDHIGVATIRNPETGGEAAPALLLHDMVPGGTGYLADLALPDRLWSLLRRAWEAVRDCPCQDEGRLACHRCLLPFAAPHMTEDVSRASAERHLRAILNSGDLSTKEVPDERAWAITREQSAKPDPESVLEQRFRVAFIALAEKLGMTVKQSPSTTGFGNTISLKQGTRSWKLSPQIQTHGTQMDFELTSSSPATKIAIYLDGYKFHASPSHNLVADDAQKRSTLRLAGYEVMSITWQDIEAFEKGNHAPSPPWLNQPQIPQLMSRYAFTGAVSDASLGGPLQSLSVLLQYFDEDAWAGFSRAVPNLVWPTRLLQVPEEQDLTQAAYQLLEGSSDLPAEEANAWWWQDGPLGVLVVPVLATAQSERPDSHIVVIIDDRADSVAKPEFHGAWRTWLSLANSLMFRGHTSSTIITTVSLAQASAVPSVTASAAAAAAELPPVWVSKAEAGFVPADLVIELVDLKVPVPELAGDEIGSGNIPVDFAWPKQRIVLLRDADEDSIDALETDGWRVFSPDQAEALAQALQEGQA